jgi:hypothetical protein
MNATMMNTIEDFKSVIQLEFQSLTNALGQKLDVGFKEVADELKIMREQGNIPVGVMQSIITSNNDTYRTIIRILCWTFGSIIVALIGLKLVFPTLFGT